ncbi:LmeA family phospholipid-binding protein [Streptomyces sp. NPDC012466]|uniref:LmeA family phospholipid-binding protein n=1 Tax=Streptomyces sp. NPDC012466 TaxID=3364835 RepID=UPI0036F1028C
MRTPHHVAAHPRPNPYEELAALDDGPLEETPLEEFLVKEPDAGAEDTWTPPDHRRGGRRRRKNRFAGLPLAVKAVVGLAVIAAFTTLADRWAVLYAEHRAADTLKDRLDLAAAPEVEIGGFPFLTQLADKRLESVKVTVPDVAADRVSLAKVSATAHDVRLDADGLTSVRGAHVPRFDGEVQLTFADLNRELGASQVTFTGEGRDRVRADGTLPVAGHDLRLRAEARIQRQGERGIATEIGNMRLDIGDLATYRPGTRPSEGLHLTPKGIADLARETRKAKALLSVPAIVQRMGVPEATVREALADDGKLAELTGSPRFARQAARLNLIDLALDNPGVMRRLGLDPELLDSLAGLTRPVLADRLSLAFELPEPEQGNVRLRDVRVQKDGIRVRVSGSGLNVGS